MNLLLTKIKRKFPDWNKRPATERDFFKMCNSERPHRVRVHSIPLTVPGFLIVTCGVPHIYINQSLRAVQWLIVGLHELGHYYFHTTAAAHAARFYRVTPNTKEEHEADFFALTALIPDSLLKKILASEEYAEDWGFAEELMKERCELFIRYQSR